MQTDTSQEQKIRGNNREGSGLLMWLAQSITLGKCCTFVLSEVKTLCVPTLRGGWAFLLFSSADELTET